MAPQMLHLREKLQMPPLDQPGPDITRQLGFGSQAVCHVDRFHQFHDHAENDNVASTVFVVVGVGCASESETKTCACGADEPSIDEVEGREGTGIKRTNQNLKLRTRSTTGFVSLSMGAFALALIPSLVLLKIALLFPFVFLAKDHFVPREGYIVT
ncbi:unnamed protein product [Sphenostylis stenocarpa]|uniref:Uncharacterized protein n=1 Tax=Sphenostylis stenocarpa TaxID=92480 RepID=A0AA86S1Z9_9FABA|nr:unnamed protein product [Sphenostylis stenocarpa]